MKLPSLNIADGIRRRSLTSFGGLDLRPGAAEGTFRETENLSSDEWPLLSVRKPRLIRGSLLSPGGIAAFGGVCTVDGGVFSWEGQEVMTLTEGQKRFACLGAYVIILPDKAWYNRLTEEHGYMECTVTIPAGGAVFKSGTYEGESAEANTLYCASSPIGAGFRPGDAVSISGCTLHPENNKTPIIREISSNGHSLRFYENVFTLDEGRAYAEPGAVTVSRNVPELDFLCENSNRLWGCKGSTIYASALGDIFNWNVFDGLASDSYQVNVGSAGDFTGCCSFLGYPVFFKSDCVYKVYGTMPSNYEVMGTVCTGVAPGCWGSIAALEGELYYEGEAGPMVWSGGLPKSIGAALGELRLTGACGAAYRGKYYLSGTDGAGQSHLLVYDAGKRLWLREDDALAMGFCVYDGLNMLTSGGQVLRLAGGGPPESGSTPESPVRWLAQLNPFTEGETGKKGLAKAGLQLEVSEGSSLTVSLRTDGGRWLTVGGVRPGERRSVYLPIVPRRCGYYEIKLEGCGDCRVYELWREYSSGSVLLPHR